MAGRNVVVHLRGKSSEKTECGQKALRRVRWQVVSMLVLAVTDNTGLVTCQHCKKTPRYERLREWALRR